MRYNHIIWDFDGTLFDSYPVMAGAFRDALLEIGIDEPVSEVEKLWKISMGHAIKHYQEHYGIGESFLSRYKEINAAHAEKYLRPFKGAAEVCRAVKEGGGGNYLLTHRGESSAYFIEKLGPAGYFAELVTSKNGFERKPSPQGILHLMELHGFSPEISAFWPV